MTESTPCNRMLRRIKGITLVGMDAFSLDEILQARERLEIQCCELAALNRTDDEQKPGQQDGELIAPAPPCR
jgi:hypothetical protein